MQQSHLNRCILRRRLRKAPRTGFAGTQDDTIVEMIISPCN